ncbi:hypothetical protein ACMAY8_14475 [Rhodobacteraceae bacterium nBUS_22]|jgi:hypothetical protein
MKSIIKYFTLIFLTISKPVFAQNWYVKDWYGSELKGGCLIATEDERSDKSIYFSYSDGRESYTKNTFNPISSISVSNILPQVLSDITYFDVTVVFNDTISFDTVVRSSVVSGVAQLSYTYIFNNEVSDFFQSEELNHELLVKLMKKSTSMKLLNDRKQTIAHFSLIGFTKIFSKYTACVHSLYP